MTWPLADLFKDDTWDLVDVDAGPVELLEGPFGVSVYRVDRNALQFKVGGTCETPISGTYW